MWTSSPLSRQTVTPHIVLREFMFQSSTEFNAADKIHKRAISCIFNILSTSPSTLSQTKQSITLQYSLQYIQYIYVFIKAEILHLSATRQYICPTYTRHISLNLKIMKSNNFLVTRGRRKHPLFVWFVSPLLARLDLLLDTQTKSRLMFNCHMLNNRHLPNHENEKVGLVNLQFI